MPFSRYEALFCSSLMPFESPRLVQIRKEAGVKAPAFIYLDEIEAGDL